MEKTTVKDTNPLQSALSQDSAGNASFMPPPFSLSAGGPDSGGAEENAAPQLENAEQPQAEMEEGAAGPGHVPDRGGDQKKPDNIDAKDSIDKGGSKPKAGGGDPKLSYKTRSGPDVLGPGSFRWVVDWNLDKKSKKGGYVVQKLNTAANIQKCDGTAVKAGGITDWTPYWEAWKVSPGKSAPDSNGDWFQFGSRGNKIKGDVSYLGEAEFYEGLTLPSSFKVNSASPAGTLPMTQSNPNLKGGSGSIPHTIRMDFDYCKTPPVEKFKTT